MNEQCWILIGGYDEELGLWQVHLQRQVSGQPASVEVDWKWAMSREDEYGDLVGFAHTHSAGAGTDPSPRDIRTMQAWCSALGKPLLCLIDEGDKMIHPVAYEFEDDQSEGILKKTFEILVA
jgi:hypothetical protein